VDSREQRDDDDDRQNEKDDRGEHEHLAFSGCLHQASMSGSPSIRCLGPKHLRHRRSALGRDDDPIDEPRNRWARRTRGEPLERRHQSGAALDIGDCLVKFPGEFTGHGRSNPFQGGDRGLTCSDSEGEQFRDIRQLLIHPLSPLVRQNGQVSVLPDQRDDSSKAGKQHRDNRIDRASTGQENQNKDATGTDTASSPQDPFEAITRDVIG
jgi:hypothetical protein